MVLLFSMREGGGLEDMSQSQSIENVKLRRANRQITWPRAKTGYHALTHIGLREVRLGNKRYVRY